MRDLALLPGALRRVPAPCVIGAGAMSRLGAACAAAAPSRTCALVVDLGVAGTQWLDAAASSIRRAGVTVHVHMLPQGEAAKSLDEVERLWDFLAGNRIDRKGAVVALGGGAAGDAAGFAAATWMRGVAVVHVPTTLLAMADSAVGGKTAINTTAGKNMVGAVHQPDAVIADLDTLSTLPDREFRAGFAEIVKCAVLADRGRLDALRAAAPALLARDPVALEDAIAFSVDTKLAHVRGDEGDTAGRRALLNLGHTVAHAIEAESGLGAWLHGEAVSVGLVAALRVAAAREAGTAAASATWPVADLLGETAGTLAAFGLPTDPPATLRPSDIVARTRADKKNEGGRRRMVLPVALDRARGGEGAALSDVPDLELERALRS